MWKYQLGLVTALTCLPTAVLAQTPGMLKAEMRKIHDPLANCDALQMLVPAGWKVDGGIRWRLDRATIAHVELRCFEPGSARQVEFLPLMPFTYAAGCEVFYPRGSISIGWEIQPAVSDVRQFVRDFVVPRNRQGARIVGFQELPDLAKTIADRESKSQRLPHTAFAGRVRLEYTVSGQAVEEDIYCVLKHCSSPFEPGRVIWGTERLYGIRSAKGNLDADAKLLQSVALSPRVELQWLHICGQVGQQLVRNELYKIRLAGETTRLFARVNRQISDESRQMWRNWREGRSDATDRFVDAIKGVDRYVSPYVNDPIELPAGYRSAWVDGLGRYVLSDQAGFDPNRDMQGTWRELPRAPR